MDKEKLEQIQHQYLLLLKKRSTIPLIQKSATACVAFSIGAMLVAIAQVPVDLGGFTGVFKFIAESLGPNLAAGVIQKLAEGKDVSADLLLTIGEVVLGNDGLLIQTADLLNQTELLRITIDQLTAEHDFQTLQLLRQGRALSRLEQMLPTWTADAVNQVLAEPLSNIEQAQRHNTEAIGAIMDLLREWQKMTEHNIKGSNPVHNPLPSTLESLEAINSLKLHCQLLVEEVEDLHSKFITLHAKDRLPVRIEYWRTSPQGIAQGQKPQDIQSVIKSHRHLIIIGEPGSGKTTALQHLALTTAEAFINSCTGPVPVYVYMRDYTGDLMHLLYSSFRTLIPQEKINLHLSAGNIVILLDGINEVETAYQHDVTRQIREMLSRYPLTQCIVTCRSFNYDEILQASKIPAVEIQPLRNEDVLDFLRRYLGDESGSSLFWEIGGNPQYAAYIPGKPLLHLCRNPLMLGMLAHLYQESGKLPANIATLFEGYIDYRFSTDKPKGGNCFSRIVKNGLLAALAYEMIDRGSLTAVNEDEAQVVLGKELVNMMGSGLCPSTISLDDIYQEVLVNGLLVSKNHRITFTHQLTQEYFAAHELKRRILGTPDEFIGHIHDLKWSETLFLCMGILDITQAEHYIDLLLSRDVVLAFECYMRTKIVGTKIRNNLISALMRILADDKEPLERRSKVTQALGALHASEATELLVHLLPTAQDPLNWAIVVALRNLSLGQFIGLDSLVELLLNIDTHMLTPYNPFAIALVATGDRVLVDRLLPILNDSDEMRRNNAAFVVGSLATDDVLNVLGSYLNNGNVHCALGAVSALGYSRNSQSVELLASALDHPIKEVRIAAIEALYNYEPESTASHYLKLLGDIDVGAQSAFYLGLSGGVFVVREQLMVLLNTDKDSVRRFHAAIALAETKCGELLTETVLMPIWEALLGENTRLGDMAAYHLGLIASTWLPIGAQIVLRLNDVVVDSGEQQRLRALKALTKLDWTVRDLELTPQAGQRLVECLRAHGQEHDLALLVLYWAKEGQPIRLLLNELNNLQSPIRVEAMVVLSNSPVNPIDIQPNLVEWLKDLLADPREILTPRSVYERGTVGYYAAGLLGTVGHEDMVTQYLTGLFRDERDFVRDNAFRAIQLIEERLGKRFSWEIGQRGDH